MAALSANGLSPGAHSVLTVSSALGGVEAILEGAISRGQTFDALFAFSDLIAFQCINALGKMGRSVPDDVAVVGFDDIQSTFALPFPLTTVSLQKELLAKSAFELLLRRISGDYSDYPVREILGVSLVVRGSSPRI